MNAPRSTQADPGGIERLSESVETVRDAGVDRIVAVATTGALDAPDRGLRLESPAFPAFLREVAAEHRRVYETLAGSGLVWTFVRPPDMPDSEATGTARVARDRLPEGGDRITTGEVAGVVVRTLEAETTGRVSKGERWTGFVAGTPECGGEPATRGSALREGC